MTKDEVGEVDRGSIIYTLRGQENFGVYSKPLEDLKAEWRDHVYVLKDHCYIESKIPASESGGKESY